MKYTKMEIELVQYHQSNDQSGENTDADMAAAHLSPANPKKKGVKSQLLGVKSFFANKFKKSKGGGA